MLCHLTFGSRFNNCRPIHMEFKECDLVSFMYFIFFFPVLMRTDPKKQRHIKTAAHNTTKAHYIRI